MNTAKTTTTSFVTELAPPFALAFFMAMLYPILTPHMWLASVAYLLMVTGICLRRRSKRAHAALMSSAVFLDLSLVAVLEIKRHAVVTALSFTLGFWQQAHIGVSTVAVTLYIPVVMLGLLSLRSRAASSPARSRLHMRLGMAAFTFRTLGFLLMFSMLNQH